jgi:hypothetical protein
MRLVAANAFDVEEIRLCANSAVACHKAPEYAQEFASVK